MVLTRSRSKSRRVDQSEDDCDTESEMKKEAETDKLPKKVTPTKKTSVPKLKGKARRTANQEQTAETSVIIVEEPLDIPTASQKSTKKNKKTPAKKKSVGRQTEELQYLSTEEDAFLSADEDHTDKVKKQRSRSISRTVAQVLPEGKIEAQVPSEDKTGNVPVSQTVNGTGEAAVTSPAVSTKRTRSGSVRGNGDSDLPEAKKKRRSSRKEAVVVVEVGPLPAPPVPDNGIGISEVKKRRSSRNVVAEPMPVPDSETAPIASISSSADVVANEVVTVDSGINRQSGVPAPSSSGRGALQKKGKKDKDTWLHNIRGGRIGKPKKLPVGERFKAQHAALLQQGENLYERSERIKQRHEEMNKSAGAVFQRLATPKKQVAESRVVKTNATATGRVAQGTSASAVATHTLDLDGDDDASENDPPAQENSNGRKPVATAKPPAKETRIPRPKANAPATNALRQKEASQKQALRSRPVTPTLTLTQPDDTSLIERLSTPKSALKPKEGLISARRGFTKKTGKLSYVDTRKLTDALYMFGIDKGILVKKALQTQFDQAVYDREVKQASKREVQMMEAIRKTIQA